MSAEEADGEAPKGPPGYERIPENWNPVRAWRFLRGSKACCEAWKGRLPQPGVPEVGREGHDGSSAFTVNVAFSETLRILYRAMREHALTLTGGDIMKTKRVGEFVMQRLQPSLLLRDLLQPLRRNALHVGAGPMLVLVEAQQFPAFPDGEPELPRPADEHELAHRAVVIGPVS